MNTYAWQSMNIFNPSMAITPPIVHIFTLLRHGDCVVNDMHYPELGCETHLSDVKMAGDAASKLTAAFSIHIDGFLGLSCFESRAGHKDVRYIARFSNHMSAGEVKTEMELKAADIIDTLMALA